MKEIKLSRGLVAMVDDADYEWLNQWKWCAIESGNGRIYASRHTSKKEGRRLVLMHRLIANASGSELVDHRDMITLNNQRHNLRRCTNTQNLFNRPSLGGTSSKFKGVSFVRGKWQAQIGVNGKKKYLGVYESETDAALAYDNEAKRLHGEFAQLNTA